MFLSCPILFLQAVWVISDILNHRMNGAKRTVLLCGCMNLFALLLHRTNGGFQFGCRYGIELIPYAFLWLLEDAHWQKPRLWEWYVLYSGLVFNFCGGMLVHLHL